MTLDEVVFGRWDLWPVLACVPAVVGAHLWAARRRRQGMLALGNPRLTARLVATVHAGNRLLRAVATICAVALVAFATLRLQYGGKAEMVPASSLDVVLVVDYSKSMLAKDVYPSRSERLEAELGRFLDEADRRGDRVGLVVFAGEPRGLPVTRDMRVLKLYLEHADPRTENPGGTAIGKALQLALGFLVDARREGSAVDDAGVEADQAVVLLTDGEDTTSRPLELAAEAGKLGIKIYTVGIGSRSGEPIQKFDDQGQPAGYVTDEKGEYVMTRIDEELLGELARRTQGAYVHVDPAQFGLDRVRESLESLSRSQRRDTIEINREEGFAFLIAPALLLLSLSLALGERRRREGGR